MIWSVLGRKAGTNVDICVRLNIIGKGISGNISKTRIIIVTWIQEVIFKVEDMFPSSYLVYRRLAFSLPFGFDGTYGRECQPKWVYPEEGWCRLPHTIHHVPTWCTCNGGWRRDLRSTPAVLTLGVREWGACSRLYSFPKRKLKCVYLYYGSVFARCGENLIWN